MKKVIELHKPIKALGETINETGYANTKVSIMGIGYDGKAVDLSKENKTFPVMDKCESILVAMTYTGKHGQQIVVNEEIEMVDVLLNSMDIIELIKEVVNPFISIDHEPLIELLKTLGYKFNENKGMITLDMAVEYLITNMPEDIETLIRLYKVVFIEKRSDLMEKMRKESEDKDEMEQGMVKQTEYSLFKDEPIVSITPSINETEFSVRVSTMSGLQVVFNIDHNGNTMATNIHISDNMSRTSEKLNMINTLKGIRGMMATNEVEDILKLCPNPLPYLKLYKEVN